MTKDGRPSLINDIRLFVGSEYPGTYLKAHEEEVAFGRRMAFYLNSERFSLGAFPALYILFTTSEEPGTVLFNHRGLEWWHRFTLVGVPEGFPSVPDVSETIKKGITASIAAVRPDQADVVMRADATVREYGKDLRFLLQRREMASGTLEISFNIEAWPKPSYMFISLTEKGTGVYKEADPIPMGTYAEGFDLVRGIRLQDARNLQERSSRPFLSERVKIRG